MTKKLVLSMDEHGVIRAKVGGNEFAIHPTDRGVRVFVSNASSRAYSGTSAMGQDFPDLIAVEHRYKSLQGIALMAYEPANTLPC